ncbi:uncharacterized protein LOC123004911 [Tribolium madens]|uniref:uncharacterized protein LOC123004911 n=1 Tax=Tribolium madens TaxID=41895 RepID=UPI001CF71EE9|nr:uncharacterized protein LOC123004911 [Tribolium madens]
MMRILLWSTLVLVHSHPAQKLKLPDLDVSTPEEVNSLEREEPLSRSIDPQSNIIDNTVQVVEEILKSDPTLPRLTRGEILDLLENITNSDDEKIKFLGRNRDPKAVMVVMPYTPTNDKNMEDLYTKAPVTHIIGAEPFKTKEEADKVKHSRRRPPVQFNDTDNDLAKKPLFSEEKKKYSASISEKVTKPTIPRNQVRRKRPEATTEAPKPSPITTKSRRPVRRRTTTAPTTYHPNHRYPEDSLPSQGIRIIESPKLAQKNDVSLPDLDFEENVKHEVTEVPPKPVIEEIMVPDNLKTVMKDLNLESALKPQAEQTRIKDILASIQVLPGTTTTTTTEVPNAEMVADSLSPEMRDLLMSFGLLPNPKPTEKPTREDQYYPEKAEVKPESYIGFKPLPDDGPSRDDMDALLASFGLGRSARRGKVLKAENRSDKSEEKYNLDMIPEHLKGVITDLGIAQERDGRKIRTSSEKQHVFNPDNQYATEEELRKLERLIGMIKELEKMNGTATEEDLKKFDLEGLKELVSSLNGENKTETLDQKEFDSPNPNNFDVGLVKNEIKRQESTTSTTSKPEAETPSLTALEESFGGKTEAPTEPPVPETTTRKTGFYYLVDWNTFLDIDDTKGKRVNLRFQPTIGDPKRFLSVSVP